MGQAAKTVGVYTSKTALARAVRRSRTAVSKHMTREDFPVRRFGPWTAKDAEKYRAWLETLQPDQSSEFKDPVAHRVNIRLKAERLLKVRLERQILQKMFVDRGEVERGLVERARMFKAGLMPLPGQLAPRLVGESNPRVIEKIIRERVVEILERLSRVETWRPGAGEDGG